MITAAVESFMENLPVLKGLFPSHWAELALDKDKVPLDPRYDVYAEREANGGLLFVTLRMDGVIIGYFIGFVAPGLHYQTCLTLMMDIFYIHPDYRDGSPRAALMLFREVEREAKRRGVQRWFVGSKTHRDASRLFEFLKFEKVETHYSKWIGA